MKIAIIGGGFTGLAAASDLLRVGHHVDLYEASPHLGGLAAGFAEPQWEWAIESYYHHWFASDKAMKKWLQELGLAHNMLYYRPQTVVWHDHHFYALDSVPSLFKFPGFSPLDTLRFLSVTAYIKFLARWQPLESVTAISWLNRYYGSKLTQLVWQPLLEGKFGSYAPKVNMAWMWARLKARTPQLGTYQGGFQACIQAIVAIEKQQGLQVFTQTPVSKVQINKKIIVSTVRKSLSYDRCLITLAPHLIPSVVPSFSQVFKDQLLDAKYLGAVVVIYALKKPLSKEGYYWYNLPKQAGFPCLAVVEHTNFVSPDHFNHEHLIYCGDYVEPSAAVLQLSEAEITSRYQKALKLINSQFKPQWIRKAWVFRTGYAQPIPFIKHSQKLVPTRSPLPGIYLANMAQVYPWDRGTNYAVALGRKVAREMITDSQ